MKQAFKPQWALALRGREQSLFCLPFDFGQVVYENIAVVTIHSECNVASQIRRDGTRETLFPEVFELFVVGFQVGVHRSSGIFAALLIKCEGMARSEGRRVGKELRH